MPFLLLTCNCSHSIHPFSIPASSNTGSQGAGAHPSCHRARGIHPGQVVSPSQGHIEKNNHPIKLTCIFLGGWKKLEHPERSPTYTGRTCKVHTERPQMRFEAGTLLLRGDGANHRATVQPIYWLYFIFNKCHMGHFGEEDSIYCSHNINNGGIYAATVLVTCLLSVCTSPPINSAFHTVIAV